LNRFIQLQNRQFRIDSPYQAGQVLSADEAEMLNAMRANSIRTALLKRFTRSGIQIETLHFNAIQTAVDAAAAEFVFASRQRQVHFVQGKGTTVEEIVETLMNEHAEEELRKMGVEYSSENRRLIRQKLDKDKELWKRVLAEADARIEAQAQVAAQIMDSLIGPGPGA
jgi:hypothetical protein